MATLKRMSVVLLLMGLLDVSRAVEGQNAADTAESRPCSAGARDSKTEKKSKKDGARNLKETAGASTTACVELRGSTLDIQEYLQSYVRKKQWRIADEVMSEDSWTFSRELTKEELLSFTKIDPKYADVNWSGGKALIQISTLELADGFSRTQIRVSFRGFGESADRFATPKPWWALDSNQSLENSLVSALENSVRSRH